VIHRLGEAPCWLLLPILIENIDLDSPLFHGEPLSDRRLVAVASVSTIITFLGPHNLKTYILCCSVTILILRYSSPISCQPPSFSLLPRQRCSKLTSTIIVLALPGRMVILGLVTLRLAPRTLISFLYEPIRREGGVKDDSGD